MSTQVSQAPHEALGLRPEDLLRMQRHMVTARLIDEASFRQNRMGRAPFVVPVSGHEGCQVGTAWAMVPGIDMWVPYYRDLGIVLVAGMTPYEVFLGVFSKADDPSSGGRQMPSHWGSRRLGIVSHSSPIATQVPHAAGIAYAMRYRGEDAVVGCWFGEGATSEGDWHEGLNFAGIHQLPVMFVCENNRVRDQRAAVQADGGARRGEPRRGLRVPRRGRGRQRRPRVLCRDADRASSARVAGDGPTLIECKTYRFLPHTSDDDDKSYRSPPGGGARHRHPDPLDRFAAYLLGAPDRRPGGARGDARRGEDGGRGARSTPAWDAADPDPATAMRHVFAEPDAGEER